MGGSDGGASREATKRYRLIGPDGEPYESDREGALGGHRLTRVYGRMKCPSADRALRRPDAPYKRHRVFFASEADAVSAGYRPCGSCMRVEYAAWKARQSSAR